MAINIQEVGKIRIVVSTKVHHGDATALLPTGFKLTFMLIQSEARVICSSIAVAFIHTFVQDAPLKIHVALLLQLRHLGS